MRKTAGTDKGVCRRVTGVVADLHVVDFPHVAVDRAHSTFVKDAAQGMEIVVKIILVVREYWGYRREPFDTVIAYPVNDRIEPLLDH